ncbi:hypothetical protein IPJ70_01370 [Candidatus Campbellbacteria bacterium]|nr:MAG: hypothetical protein IPJ70_01370 [Candidatus Campbellbacteria bacterium]
MDPVTTGAPQQNSAPQESHAVDPASKNTLMGILSYLGPLVLVPFFTNKEQPFVKFHIKQGLVVFSIELIAYVLGMFMWQLWVIRNLVNLATLILSIIGIVNVVEKKEKELPLVGSFSKYFTF